MDANRSGPTSAEDLVQETLLRAYRVMERFDGRHPRAWLLTILRNTWRNMNRRGRPRLLRTTDEILSVAADGADGRSGAEEHVVDRMIDGELVAGLRQLSDNHRSVAMLIDVDGLTYQEAADDARCAAGDRDQPTASGAHPIADTARAARLRLATLAPPLAPDELARLRAFADDLV